ncbi:MAG: transporter substrate-binding domain-containing protein [Ruminococcaceae bacterium]|nr:transporter substrate-binding domain-containing protein [Oscillospiraceae bacterium]
MEELHMKKILALLMVVLMVATFMVGCTENTAKTAKVVEVDLTQEFYAFGVDKAQPELLAKVNTFIKQIKEDGTLDSICNKYFGEGTPEAVESAQLDESKEQLVVATNAAFEPFEYMEGDKYLGIDMEIAKLLADYLEMELVINNMEFDAVCLSVGQHKCDIAMAGLTINEKRKESVDFTESYYEASQRLIVKSDDTTFDGVTTVEDVEAKLNSLGTDVKVGYQNGTTGQFYVQGDADWGFDGLKVTGVGYQNGSLAVQDMLNGNLDYVIIDKEPATFITESINALA